MAKKVKPEIETLPEMAQQDLPEVAPEAVPEVEDVTPAGDVAESVADDTVDPPSDDAPEDGPAAAPETEPASEPIVKPAPNRGGFWPMLLGGALTAGLGAGAMAVLMPEGWRAAAPDMTAFDAVVAEQVGRQAGLEAEIADLRAKLSLLGPVEQEMLDLEAQQAAFAQAMTAAATQTGAALDEVRAMQDAVDGRLVALEKRPVDGGAASATALEAFERDMAEMRELLSAGREGAQVAEAAIAEAAAAAETRLAEVEAEAQRLSEAAETAARAGALQAALSHLQTAFASGAALEPAFDSLRSSGVDLPEELTNLALAAPSLAELQRAFPAAARGALISVREAEPKPEGATERAVAFLKAQSGIRSLEPREGPDADAVLSRAEAALRSGDLHKTLSEIDALPAEGQSAIAAWRDLAQTRLSAAAAIADFTQITE